MIRVFAAVAGLAFAAPAFAQSADSRLTFTFETGARTGAVLVALYDSEAAYEGDVPTRLARVDVAAGQRAAVFERLAAGAYGMKAFHDVNDDGEMNVNPFGMPTEPYAFSNNAVGNMGPAKWDRARFEVSGATAQTIRIR
ncbi:DUF2141 domain-containing protein [Brevundimonas naejangsanensis]|uniref:DUF2141 domain-containing protein n=2 Tax=Brevundimonas naejangsanensis TaxID=588932 RepID=A0A494RIS9_9CAUL|nr:DUF2141 domain-containing protein [Brevundimonas naejangsanensis]